MGNSLDEMTLEELWELFPIILREHNFEYKEWYLEEKENLYKVIGPDEIKRINHIGSSAVAGLIAKPTVDILAEVSDTCAIDKLREKLIDAGWREMSFQKDPDLNISMNKGYTSTGFAEKVFHLHVRYLGDWDELYFRDYLLKNKEVAKNYGELKQKLIIEYEHDRDGYTGAKTAFIKSWTEKAREEFGDRYVP